MEQLIAKELLKIGAVFLRPQEPFTWASGIKSPIYCDNRLTLSYPETRDKVENGLASLVKTYFPECEALMGTSTAGIAHAALTAQILSLPMGYVRGEAKSKNNPYNRVLDWFKATFPRFYDVPECNDRNEIIVKPHDYPSTDTVVELVAMDA